MFLLIILFGLAALGLAFMLYLQADLPAAHPTQLNPPAAVGKPATPSTAPQPNSATPAPAAGSMDASPDAGTGVTGSTATPAPAPTTTPSGTDID